VAGPFQVQGGSNDAITHTATTYIWTRTEAQTTELLSATPVGPQGFTALGLRIERLGVDPGIGRGWDHTLRRSGSDTPIVVSLFDTARSGTVSGFNEPFVSGETINIEIDPTNTPATSRMHWGLGLLIPPFSINCPPNLPNIVVSSPDGLPVQVFYTNTPTITGGVPPFPVVFSPPSGTFFPIGTTVVTVTVTDSLGATAQCFFTVTVLPPPPLVAGCPIPQPQPITVPDPACPTPILP
jgi:hypothetical protein